MLFVAIELSVRSDVIMLMRERSVAKSEPSGKVISLSDINVDEESGEECLFLSSGQKVM